MDTDPIRVDVIVGSNREGRFGDTVARWFVARARTRGDMTVDTIDLVDFDLPFVYPRHPNAEVRRLVARIDRADAFVVITPEYNHGYPASLKQAIDLAHREWNAKPVGFVSYGGTSGGLLAVEQLRQVFAELHAVTARNVVSFHRFWERFDENGRIVEPATCETAAERMLDELTWWARALRDARSRSPFAA